MMIETILYGRMFLKFTVKTITGLTVGGNDAGLEIGGVDKVIIRNPLTNQPYIPGSSLRGKMRSQLEKALRLSQKWSIGSNVKIHVCDTEAEFIRGDGCPVCHVLGLPGQMDFSEPTRLIVRDVPLDLETEEGKAIWEKAKLDLQYAELKTEVAINRVTSAATPRTLERVPAGAIFGPAELVFSIYDRADFARLKYVLDALQLVEDDYLGGAGSRGSGKVKFTNICVTARAAKEYANEKKFNEQPMDVRALALQFNDLSRWAQDNIPVG